MASEGKYKMVSRVDGLESRIKILIGQTKNAQEIFDERLKHGEDEHIAKFLKEMSYDCDAEILLYKQLMNVITMWKSTICITEEKLM